MKLYNFRCVYCTVIIKQKQIPLYLHIVKHQFAHTRLNYLLLMYSNN